MLKFNLSQIQSITSGAVRVTHEEQGFHFYRFTKEQELLYKERDEDFYGKTFAASGVQLRFQTDSDYVFLSADITKRSSRSYFCLEVFSNGTRIGAMNNFDEMLLPTNYTALSFPTGEFSKRFSLGAGTKEVRIVFPFSAEVVLKTFELADGSTIKPLRYTEKMLCFGDSITQGYDALYSSHKYTTQIAEWLGLEEVNKGIGGEIFFPELASTKEDFVPKLITVAYGTNDFARCTKEEFTQNCHTFFSALFQTYPAVKVVALAPIWRKECQTTTDCGSFFEVAACIQNAVEKYDNATFVSAFDCVPHNEALFADGYLHPNDKGFMYYYENLKQKLSSILEQE